MAFAVIWMGVVVVAVVVGFIITRGQRDRAWKQLANELGAEFVSGGAFGSSKVRAQIKQWTVTLDTYSVGAGDSSTTYTRMRVPVQNKDAFQFKIFREGVIGKLDKALGAQDIEIGVPEFDRNFVIQSRDESKVRALLADVKIRQLIQGQRSITLELKGEALNFNAQGVIRDVARLKSLFELFGETLDQLEG